MVAGSSKAVAWVFFPSLLPVPGGDISETSSSVTLDVAVLVISIVFVMVQACALALTKQCLRSLVFTGLLIFLSWN